jgi:hypothetical protein
MPLELKKTKLARTLTQIKKRKERFRSCSFQVLTTIHKKDILFLCELLNEFPMYKKNKCKVKPKEGCGGGIQVCYPELQGYKAVHFHLPVGKWVWVENAVFRPEWKTLQGKLPLWEEGATVRFSFHVYNGAEKFTKEELGFWKNCFFKLGLKKN